MNLQVDKSINLVRLVEALASGGFEIKARGISLEIVKKEKNVIEKTSELIESGNIPDYTYND
jgi:hypothetical protein